MAKQEEIHVKQRESTRIDFRLEEFQTLEHLATAIHRRLRETGSLRPIQHDRGREWMEPERQQEIIDYIYEHPNASCRSVADALGIASHVSVWHVLRMENLHHFVTRQFKD